MKDRDERGQDLLQLVLRIENYELIEETVVGLEAEMEAKHLEQVVEKYQRYQAEGNIQKRQKLEGILTLLCENIEPATIGDFEGVPDIKNRVPLINNQKGGIPEEGTVFWLGAQTQNIIGRTGRRKT